jgi:hypothetical protein
LVDGVGVDSFVQRSDNAALDAAFERRDEEIVKPAGATVQLEADVCDSCVHVLSNKNRVERSSAADVE